MQLKSQKAAAGVCAMAYRHGWRWRNRRGEINGWLTRICRNNGNQLNQRMAGVCGRKPREA
jgi:hypothetical protein